MKNKREFAEGQVPKMVEYICGLIDRSKTTDPKYVMANLVNVFPQLQQKEKCPNCSASMEQYTGVFDCMDAWVLIEMARTVKNRLQKGLKFNEANQVRVQDLNVSYSAKSRTTWCSKLNLITQLQRKNKKGVMINVPGIWVITRNGWAALRGEPVRKRVTIWRNSILDRHEEETITISEAFKINRDLIDEMIARNKTIRGDYRAIADDYKPQEWVEFAGSIEGMLL